MGAGAAPGEDPKDATALGAAAELLRVLFLVPANRSGLAHLAHAGAAGRLAAEKRPAHLDEPAVNRGGLSPVVPVGPFRLLCVRTIEVRTELIEWRAPSAGREHAPSPIRWGELQASLDV